MQVSDPIIGKPSAAAESALTNNDVENILVLTRVYAYPGITAPGTSVVLSVDYQENMGRPSSVSWTCNQGTLLSEKGNRVTWIAPDKAGTYECEATVKSKSGQVRGVARIIVEAPSN